MIKVTVGEQKTQSEKPFPKLMKSIKSDLLVFMLYESVGIAMNQSDEYHIGFYSDSWDENAFYDYNEPITLQNS